MSQDTFFRDHWVTIEPERIERYERMFAWSGAYERMLEPAQIGPGQVVADFGCGPGHTAIELARRVGEGGHVHAMDINAELVARTLAKAQAEGVAERVTGHHLTGGALPLAPDTLDRLISKSVLVYVDDPLAAFQEFHRVTRPGGIVHAVDSDWGTTIVEPVPLEQWRTFLAAASHAFRTPLIGRRMLGLARQAGFAEARLQIAATPDTKGVYVNLVHNLAGYAREGGTLDEAEIQAVVDLVEQAVTDGTYLAINPQFMVTATV